MYVLVSPPLPMIVVFEKLPEFDQVSCVSCPESVFEGEVWRLLTDGRWPTCTVNDAVVG